MSGSNYDRYSYESIDVSLKCMCAQILKECGSSRDRARISPALEQMAGDIRAGCLELIRDIEDPLWDTHWDEVARRICAERFKARVPFTQCDEDTLGDDNYLIGCYIPDGAMKCLSSCASCCKRDSLVDCACSSIDNAMGNLIQSLCMKIYGCR